MIVKITKSLLRFFNNIYSFEIYKRSSKWRSVREIHLSKNRVCAACGRDKDLDVHHIEPVYIKPERELDPTNLITLCADPCHLVFGHLMNYKRWNIDVIEDCASYYSKIKNNSIK